MLTPRRGDPEVSRLLHQAGVAAVSRGAIDNAVGYLRRALDEPPARAERPGLLLELGQVEALVRGPEAALHLREAYDGLTDPRMKVRAANALGRALLFTSSPAEGAAVAREAARSLPPELADEALALEAFALMGVAFGGLDPEESKLTHPFRTIRPRTLGEKSMAAVAALEWGQDGGHVDDVVALGTAALEGGELDEPGPEPAHRWPRCCR